MGTTRRSIGPIGMAVCAVVAIQLLGPAGAAANGSGMGVETVAQRGPAETCEPARIPFDAEDLQLTGLWSADGTIYYVRHVGDKVWFSAMSDFAQRRGEIGREVTSVGLGTLDGTSLTVEIAEVPRGEVWNSGTISVALGADADGNLEARSLNPEDGSTTVLTPCATAPREVTWFARPFSYAVPFGLAAWDPPGSTDLQVLQSPDMPGSGISFWALGPGWQPTCSTPPELSIPTERTPAAVEAYLRAIPQLVVGEAATATVAGLPATVLDVRTTPDATGCADDGYVRMFKESGNESGMGVGQSARLLLLDAGDATFVIEVWGDLDAWLPIAQRVVDSVQLDLAAVPREAVGTVAADGARVIRVDALDERTRDLTIESPSVGYAKVRLLLPEGWEAGSTRTWPTLYLLHGAWADFRSWTDEGHVADIPELRDVLVVMPDGGQLGFYSDWSNGGRGGQPAWETFHTLELPEIVEADWGGGQERAVAGLSMGGFGALSYAARHPGMFGAAASYSGVVDILTEGTDADPMRWGDRTADQATWEEHNPLSQAASLEGTDLYISYGNGRSGPLDAAGPGSDDLEGWVAPQNEALVARLEELGIPATVEGYGDGTHTWPYWERALRASLPVLLGGASD